MLDCWLTLDHAIGDAMPLVHIWGNGLFGINASLKGRELPAIQSTAHRPAFNQSVLNRIPAGGIGVEGPRRDMYKSPTALLRGVCRVGRWLNRSAAPPEL